MKDQERLKKYNEERHADALLLAVMCYDEYRHDPEVKLKKFARYLERCRESNLKWQALSKKLEEKEIKQKIKYYENLGKEEQDHEESTMPGVS